MDPAIANKDFDPPRPVPLTRRFLLPALLVNAVFVGALVWSAPWHRSASSVSTLPADLHAMGSASASVAAADPAPMAPLPSPREPASVQPTARAMEAVPQPGSVYRGTSSDTRETRAVPPRAPAPMSSATPTPTGPSFDCVKARSPSEKLICGDPELAQLDRDLGRLNVRARAASADQQAFRRAGDVEWKRRETECRDKACLLTWYEQRRAQLQQLLDRGEKTAVR